MSAEARVRGWCPGAWRPMATGDGLLVRVRPRLGRLTRAQMLALCDAAETWGSGLVELTRRANLQLRGVSEAGWPALMACLVERELVAPDAQAERRPALLVAPDWQPGDTTHKAAHLLEARMAEWPTLPAKWGLAIDAGPAPVLMEASADLRLERSAGGGLLVRADGRALGTPVGSIEAAVELLRRLAHWFVDSGGTGRMHRLTAPLPAWAPATMAPAGPAESAASLTLGDHRRGRVVGLPFGRAPASALRDALGDDVNAIRVTPWRRLLLEGENVNMSEGAPDGGLIHDARDPRLAMDACPGAPHCERASVATLGLAQALAERLSGGGMGRVHVSGCAKGCARGRPAEVCLTGRDGRFDLILGGRADDTPVATGLSEADVIALTTPASERTSLGDKSERGSYARGEEHGSERAGHGWPAPDLQAERDARAQQGVGSAQGRVHSALATPCCREGFIGRKQMPHVYETDGPAIYRESFATIRREAELARFSPEEEPVAVRMIHAAGLVALAAHVHFRDDVVNRARRALEAGAPILCDARMVAEGITRQRLPADNAILCTLHDERVPGLAREMANTRSAAALELWRPHLDGAVVAIGNAPTALFHLLNMLEAPDCPRPAAIIGCPVGFVGAAESKQALWESAAAPCAIVEGRLGGSAVTVAAVNAMADRRE
ncbi:precorrin isomerase [Halomonas stenophila]|uniref:Precorrin isomerase n=2 Tax=Halomonas stenophila TaxID=795312 RepID=A0A7W5EWB4_9GAMM|nr:precorrin isomerase [Halomonas stenophila]